MVEAGQFTAAASSPAPSVLRAMSPLDGRYASAAGVTLSPIAPRTRLALRVGEGDLAGVESALGFALPRRPKMVTGEGAVSALWLGPDDWLLVDESEGRDPLAARPPLAERFDGVTAPFSLVDVTHRSVAISLDGPAAEAVISAGCAQDIRLPSFPVGSATRTILTKADIVLWRRAEHRFEIACWRSFADYVWTLLAVAARAPAI
ncbi:sarcosine oxidase subunit gamma [Aureimonas sp. Leaf454]|uniref:sarcosine oxidase subunit gamma n=1 Tax=Aureimonas sp. Leaf454 TaxID=1736381 RepID=UPI0006F6F541|nr:sarcosine oxidase subunit gamma family protein [Aureimonas sp. Leaf454]KQT45243.1 sarcosine oxidase subunit gamma [Aureimonas sp. Leaf454]